MKNLGGGGNMYQMVGFAVTLFVSLFRLFFRNRPDNVRGHDVDFSTIFDALTNMALYETDHRIAEMVDRNNRLLRATYPHVIPLPTVTELLQNYTSCHVTVVMLLALLNIPEWDCSWRTDVGNGEPINLHLLQREIQENFIVHVQFGLPDGGDHHILMIYNPSTRSCHIYQSWEGVYNVQQWINAGGAVGQDLGSVMSIIERLTHPDASPQSRIENARILFTFVGTSKDLFDEFSELSEKRWWVKSYTVFKRRF